MKPIWKFHWTMDHNMTWGFSKILIRGGARAGQSGDLANFFEFRGPRRRVTFSASTESKFGTEVCEVMLQCHLSTFFDSAARGPSSAKKLHFLGFLGQIYLLLGY